MNTYLGCELCEREGVEAVGTTHLGGHRYEVCAECREIVKSARRQIASLNSPATDRSPNQNPLQMFSQVGGPGLHPKNWTPRSDYFAGRICPGCGQAGTLGPANVDGHPGCHHCLYRLRSDD